VQYLQLEPLGLVLHKKPSWQQAPGLSEFVWSSSFSDCFFRVFTAKNPSDSAHQVVGSPLNCQPLATAQFYASEGLTLSFDAFRMQLIHVKQGDIYLLSELLKGKTLNQGCRGL
jgi:hypothetical protein